jgi:hypothetical protein
MPARAMNARRFADFIRDKRELRLCQPAHVNLDMKSIVGTQFGDDPPRNNIQIVKALDYTNYGERVSVRDNPKSQDGEILLRRHGTNSA